MTASRDRLQMVRELHEETLTFQTNCEMLPKAVIGQCLVSYKKFVDYVLFNYGVDIFFDCVNVDISIILKDQKSKIVNGFKVECNSIKSAIRIASKALKRSRHESFEVSIKVDHLDIPYPILKYSASMTGKPKRIKCKIFNMKDKLSNVKHAD